MYDPSQYDVFLSYAHKDVYGHPKREEYLLELKKAIEQLAGRPLVFLDSDAIQPGETWNSKIQAGICSCKVFLCLLSANYLTSEYCKREYLWWCQKELGRGRLRKMTLPVYYVQFPDELDDVRKRSRLAEDLLSFQLEREARPWFGDGENSFKEELVRERLKEVVDRTEECLSAEKAAEAGFCSVRPYNRAFVGRLREIREIWDECRKGCHPVLHAGGGVGKTELAVAYAHGFASEYPQGRFFVPMEGVASWDEAMSRLLDGCEVDPNKDEQSAAQLFGIRRADVSAESGSIGHVVWQTLVRRAKDGPLLLLLDNLDDMALLSVKGLAAMAPRGVPGNIHILVTTRNTPELVYESKFRSVEIGNLDEDTAIELLRTYCQDAPFNLDEPSDSDPEYSAARQIVDYLDGHAWSLEIVGGDVGQNWRRGMTFAKKLEKLQKVCDIAGKNRFEEMQTAEDLLRPTLDVLQESAQGQSALEVLLIASLFKPECIPASFLRMYVEECRVEKGDSDTLSSCDLAVDLLRRYHLVQCPGVSGAQPVPDDGVLRMHRLTCGVLSRLFPDRRLDMARCFWSVLLPRLKKQARSSDCRIVSRKVRDLEAGLAVCAFLERSGDAAVAVNYCQCLSDVGSAQFEAGDCAAAKRSFDAVIERIRHLPQDDTAKPMLAAALHERARICHMEGDYPSEELYLSEALGIRRAYYQMNPQQWADRYARTLHNFGMLQRAQGRDQEALRTNGESVEIKRGLLQKDRQQNLTNVASGLRERAYVQRSLGDLLAARESAIEALKLAREAAEHSRMTVLLELRYSLSCCGYVFRTSRMYQEAFEYCSEAVAVQRELVAIDKHVYVRHLGSVLCGLAGVNDDRHQYSEAAANYAEAVEIQRSLVEKNRAVYLSGYARVLNGMGCIHSRYCRHAESMKYFDEVVQIRQELVESDRGDKSSLALGYANLACSHRALGEFAEAESAIGKALEIRRELARDGRNATLSDLARGLAVLGSIKKAQRRFDEAESSYREGIEFRRTLFSRDEHVWAASYAGALENLASIYGTRNQVKDAETLREEVLRIREKLVQDDRQAYLAGYASALVSKAYSRYAVCDFTSALTLCDEALTFRKELYAQDPDASTEALAFALRSRGRILCEMDKVDEGVANLQEAVALRRKRYQENAYYGSRQGLAGALLYYGIAEMSAGELSKAECALNECRSLLDQLLESSCSDNLEALAVTQCAMSELYLMQGRIAEADKMAADAEMTIRELLPANVTGNEPDLAVCLCLRSKISLSRGDTAVSEKLADEAKSLANKNPMLRMCRHVLNGRAVV